MIKAIIYEQGNGLPEAGDYCGGEGQLWLVESIDSRIQTGDPRGNYVEATVSEADWSDCSEGDEHTALVEIAAEEPLRCADYDRGAPYARQTR